MILKTENHYLVNEYHDYDITLEVHHWGIVSYVSIDDGPYVSFKWIDYTIDEILDNFRSDTQ